MNKGTKITIAITLVICIVLSIGLFFLTSKTRSGDILIPDTNLPWTPIEPGKPGITTAKPEHPIGVLPPDEGDWPDINEQELAYSFYGYNGDFHQEEFEEEFESQIERKMGSSTFEYHYEDETVVSRVHNKGKSKIYTFRVVDNLV